MVELVSIRLQAQAFIEKAVLQGLSANKTLDVLRSYGLGYRRTDFLKDYSRIAGRPQRTERAKYTPLKYLPPEESFEETPFVLLTQYVYHFRVKSVDKSTGKELNERFSIGVNDKVSIGQARELLSNALIERQDEYGKEVKALTFEFAWKRS